MAHCEYRSCGKVAPVPVIDVAPKAGAAAIRSTRAAITTITTEAPGLLLILFMRVLLSAFVDGDAAARLAATTVTEGSLRTVC